MTRILGCLSIILAGSILCARAVPPMLFNYSGSLKLADQTVQSDIPKEKRFYVIGPDEEVRWGPYDAKPTTHRAIRAFKYRSTLNLGVLLKKLPLNSKKIYEVVVYRKDTPATSFASNDPSLAKFSVQARDMIFVVDSGKQAVTVTSTE